MRSRDFASPGKLLNLPCLAGVLRDDFRPDSDVDVLVTYEPSHSLTRSHLLDMHEEIEHLFYRLMIVDRGDMILFAIIGGLLARD